MSAVSGCFQQSVASGYSRHALRGGLPVRMQGCRRCCWHQAHLLSGAYMFATEVLVVECLEAAAAVVGTVPLGLLQLVLQMRAAGPW
eukprot:6461528-Amphidinium_carterae.3